jgi:antitoxin ParD1/3/4
MNVSLTPKLEQIIRKKVETGLYSNASEVVREAIRQMDGRDSFTRLRAAIDEADQEFARGEYYELTPQLLEEMTRESELDIDDDTDVDVHP